MQLTTSVAHPTVMFRKNVFEQLGGYKTDFCFAEDLDLWLRWINAGHGIANLPQVLVQYRQDKTHRNHQHWRYNLRARISNFKFSYSIRRIFGIACIATWAALPNVIQNYIFKFLILDYRNKGGTS
jgi:GT2 family glycosyltransferase